MPILNRIPDISLIANVSGNVLSRLGVLLNALGGLETPGDGSPIATIVGTFNDLKTPLDIDMSPLTNGLTTLTQGLQTTAWTIGQCWLRMTLCSDTTMTLTATSPRCRTQVVPPRT
jgi:hypothetical protein